MDRRKGIRVRSGSGIEIDFVYRGQRCRETLKGRAPTKPNLLYSIGKRDSILRAIFADAFSDGVIDRNPLDRIQNLSNRMEEPDPFTPAEIASILAAMEEQTRNLFAFAFWTGLRTSDP
jgi:integrase